MNNEQKCLRMLLVVCGLLGLLTPTAQAAITLGAARDLPILTRLDPLGFSLAVLDDGSFAIAGVETIEPPREPGTSRFLVQFFGPNADPKSDPITFVEATDQGFFGGVGAIGNRYFVTWQNWASQQTLASFYDEEGNSLGDPFRWPNSEIFYYNREYRFGPGPEWHILPAFYHRVGFTWLQDPVFQPLLQVYDKQARALGLPFTLGDPLRPGFVEDAAINGSGRFVVLEDQCPWSAVKPPRECTRGVQVFDGGGRPRTSFLTQNIAQFRESHGKLNSTGAVAIDSKGNFLLVWAADVFGPTQHLVARLYDRNGRALSGIISVRDAPTLSFNRILALSSGEFLIPFQIISGVPPQGVLYLQELQTSNRRLLPPVLAASDIYQGFHLLEVNSSGHGVVAWTTVDAQGNGAGHFRLVTVTGRAAAPENDGTPAVDESGTNEP